MFITKINNLRELDSIDASFYAKNLARKKGMIFYFKIEDLNLSAAQILKQEALSAGAEFVLPKDNILGVQKNYDGILIASARALEIIIAKCKIQPFGLKMCAEILESHIRANNRGGGKNGDDFRGKNGGDSGDFQSAQNSPKIMGIINVTDDSFYANSRIKEVDLIIKKIHEMIESGASIIDIGAASSRPGSEFVESSIEIRALREAFSEIKRENLAQMADFSIDSYNFETIDFALQHDFSIINDISGLKDSRIMALGAQTDAKIILMHNSWITPHGANIIQSVDDFFAQKLLELRELGVENERVWLDVGFGFGKNMNENLELIKNLAHFRHFGCEILIGASRKRTIGEVTNKSTNERLAGTLALHQISLLNGADIIRCHDVSEHVDMLKILKAIA